MCEYLYGEMNNVLMEIEQRIELSKRALKGISIGDAFGESFFGETSIIDRHLFNRTIPTTKWEFTDDTVMAIAVYEQLKNNQDINQDQLAEKFAINHDRDVNRGYGATARKILRAIGEGRSWKEESSRVFEGMGSMGNGASMRVGPIGAFYFDDLKKVKDLAIKSAEVTHSNIEGITGAIAVAIASAIATQIHINTNKVSSEDFIKRVLTQLPDSDTTAKINKSLSVSSHFNVETVKSILGNGTKIMAQDTVPFSIWCAAHNLNNFEESIWKAISVLGDRDTICAIVGGITIMSSSDDSLPAHWSENVEDFETSIFMKP